MVLIGTTNTSKISAEDLAAECRVLSDKLNNLLTAVQLKAGILVEVSNDERLNEGLRDILAIAADAANHSARLQDMSRRFGD